MSTNRCERCTPSDIATHVIVDRWLVDPETIRVMGGPYNLDGDGPNSVGVLVCDRCADAVVLVGYRVAEIPTAAAFA